MAVIFDHFGAIIFGEQVQVFLSVNVDLLFSRFVFETELVAAFTLVGLGFQGGAGFMLRQRVGRCIGGVVCSSRDDGLIRIAIQEGDDDFVADSWQCHEPILAARPALAYP